MKLYNRIGMGTSLALMSICANAGDFKLEQKNIQDTRAVWERLEDREASRISCNVPEERITLSVILKNQADATFFRTWDLPSEVCNSQLRANRIQESQDFGTLLAHVSQGRMVTRFYEIRRDCKTDLVTKVETCTSQYGQERLKQVVYGMADENGKILSFQADLQPVGKE